MAKKKGRQRLQMQKRPKKVKLESEGTIPPDFRKAAEAHFGDVFGELEPLTEDLITELIEQGWEEVRLREAQKMGLYYSRKRNSFTMAV